MPLLFKRNEKKKKRDPNTSASQENTTLSFCVQARESEQNFFFQKHRYFADTFLYFSDKTRRQAKVLLYTSV